MCPSMPAQGPQGPPHGDQPAVEKGGTGDQRGRLIGRTKGGMNTKLHAVTDADGRQIRFFMTAGPPLSDASIIACRAAVQRSHGCCGPAG